MGSTYNHSVEGTIRRQRSVVPEESLSISQLLSLELMKLSFTDRSAIDEEIHGVRCLAIEETPELIQKALHDFQTELDKMAPDQKPTYEKCRIMQHGEEGGSCYALHDRNFRLRFLRAELFDAKKATLRFTRYLDFVQEYWGLSIAAKRLVRLSDFSKEEIKVHRKGYFQTLPFRDRSGRRVITCLGGLTPDINPELRMKALFYLTDVLTRNDVESQKVGVLAITEAYCWSTPEVGSDKRSNTSFSFANPQESLHIWKQYFEAIPVRIVAIHNCWPDHPAFQMIAKLLTVYGLSEATSRRLRLKFHTGDELEMRYRMKSYGIPIELLPITETGTIKTVNHNLWMKARKLIEQDFDADVTLVECPGINDVVFRKGTSSMENPGNAQYEGLIVTLLDEESNTRSILGQLIDTVHNQQRGRFLEWSKAYSSWIHITDVVKIKKKTASLLKRYRRQTKRRNHKNASTRMHVDVPQSTESAKQGLQPTDIGSSDEDQDQHHTKQRVNACDNVVLLRGMGPYIFVEGREHPLQDQDCCRIVESDSSLSAEHGRKRYRKS